MLKQRFPRLSPRCRNVTMQLTNVPSKMSLSALDHCKKLGGIGEEVCIILSVTLLSLVVYVHASFTLISAIRPNLQHNGQHQSPSILSMFRPTHVSCWSCSLIECVIAIRALEYQIHTNCNAPTRRQNPAPPSPHIWMGSRLEILALHFHASIDRKHVYI